MSQDRDLNVNVTATTDKFERGMRKASAEARKLEREVKRQERVAEDFRRNTGRAMLGVGVGIVAAAGLATRAAVQWESAWAGVTKTVDGSAAQMARLEGDLRSMARELPATHEEIAAVAEAAGQLGIKRESIAGFTRTMIALGETTNLSADEAATALARFSNIMGTAHADVDRLGSVLVDLGNNSATTEAEILELGTRLAAAGRIAGLSESDVFAFASTLTSVGVEAEAGGTALSKVFTSIRDAVLTGSEELDVFARVAGVTASDFARSFEQDPARAIASFIEGLGRMNESGQSTTEVFRDLELTDQRLMRALLSTGAAGDLLTESLALGNRAWEENSALVEEAAKRYETTESKMQVARNNINDLGITLGQIVLPVLGEFAETVRGLVLVFEDLPGPVKTALSIFGSLVGVIALAGGAALLAGPKIGKLRTAAETMTASASGLNRGLGKVGTFLTGPWGAAIGAATLAVGLFAAEKADAAVEVDEFRQAIEADNGVLGENARLTALKKLQDRGMTDSLRAANIPLGEAVDALLSQGSALDSVMGRLRAYNDEQASTIGNLTSVSEAWYGVGESLGLNEEGVYDNERALHELVGSLSAAREKAREQKEVFGDELPGAMGAAETATDELSTAQHNLAGKFDLSAEDAKTAQDAIEDYLTELKAATDPVFALIDALDGVESAQADYTKAVKDHGKNSDEAKAAAVGLAKAVASTEAAAINGDLSYDEFKATLKRWVSQGALTAKQAKAIEERVKDARTAAKMFEGAYEADILADTDRANKTLEHFVKKWRGQRIDFNAGAMGEIAANRQRERRAHGGGVFGPGGPTDDQIPALLSNNEHVWTAREVAAAGGHGAVQRLREFALAGRLASLHEKRFAKGGGVILDATVDVSAADKTMRDALAVLTSGGGVLAFVRSQVGKPYVWGGTGPGGYDCSGLIGAAVNKALGRNPHSRIGTTGTFPWSMFAPGPGAFMVGSFRGNPGHMAGTVNGVNIESRGGDGVVMGPSARGANSGMFTTRAHLRGFAKGGRVEGDPPFDQLDPRGKHFGGFDGGGLARGSGLLAKHVIHPERVLSPRQTASFERLVTVLDTRSSGSSTIRLHPEDIRAIAKAQTRELSQNGKWLAAVNSGRRADILTRTDG